MSDLISRLNAALVGRYRIERELGQGGMATVYLADDVRHGRQVALKVLRPEVASAVGAERFLAEIKTTAKLSHPHILPLFDSGQADGFLFYVMPYVQGESLRDRLTREHELPVEDAVRIATQVAEALEHAHGLGVVHRDIKPENILLHQGNAMVADFGIALALGGQTTGRLTELGVTLGTPRYMSPEQATGGSNVGPATDVWALGCILYEMLAGEPPYGGSTPQAILGSIVSAAAEPVTQKRRSTPAHVAAAVARATERVPSDRFTSAQAFARALGDAGYRYGEGPGRRSWVVGAASAAAAAVLLVVGWNAMRPSRDMAPSVRLVIPGLTAGLRGASSALSEDGAYVAHAAGGPLTIRRTTNASVADTLTSDAGSPFFSPDGESIAYMRGANLDLMRMARAGGTPRLLAAGTGARMRGGTWGDDGTIVWATTSGLYRVDAEGGDVQVLATPDTAAGELEYSAPELLPGSDAVLFTIVPRGAESGRDVSIASLDLESGDITTVLRGGSSPRYVEAGYLVYSVDGSLRAVEFDARRRRTRGEPVELGIEGVAITDGWGADFDIAGDGTLAYQLSTDVFSTLVWRDRDGREEALGAPPALYGYRRISPDGGRVVYDRRRPGGGPTRDLYIWDVDRRVEVRLTDDPGEEFFGDWTPDGDTIYYSSDRGGGTINIWRRAADGSGEPELVLARPSAQMLNDMLPDGRGILVAEVNEGRFDLVQISLVEPVSARPLLSTPAHEYNAFVSPDGRFYAYQTDRDGQFEVWVRPLGASSDGPVKVSVDGGLDATWSRDGTEIFYRARDASIMAAHIVTTPRLSVGEVVQLLPPLEPMSFTAVGGRGWDVSPRDGRILWGRRPVPPDAGIRVVLNWEQELLAAMER
jgi:serine/threonine-protein kinase